MQLRFTKEELKNLIKLCNNSIKTDVNDKEILFQFKKKNLENDNLLGVFNKYMSLREHIAECEDTQCDTSYLEEHELHKKNYLSHLDRYRKLKDRFYVDVNEQLKLNNNR